MIGVALKGLLGRKLRAILTAFAIVLGVAMISGSFVLTDTLARASTASTKESYKGTDAVISSKPGDQHDDGDDRDAPFSAGVLRSVQVSRRRAAPRARSRTRPASSTRTASRSARPTALAVAVDAGSPTRARTRQARRGHVAAAATARSRSTAATAAQAPLRGRPDGRRLRRRPGPALPDQRHRPFGVGRHASPAHYHSCSTCRPPQRLFDKQGKLDADPRRREPTASRGERSSARSARCSRGTTRSRPSRPRPPPTARRRRTASSVFKYFLLGFGGIALFVGSFVIANTLAITVAQRMRELATLRTLGASRRQVLGRSCSSRCIVGSSAR